MIPIAAMGAASTGTATGSKPMRLSSTVLRSLIACVVMSTLLTMSVVAALFFNASEQQAEQSLLDRTGEVATLLDAMPTDERIGFLELQSFKPNRATLIDADGTVLWDSEIPDVSGIENHADRPEIKAALSNGTQALMRRSATIGTDTLYAAVVLDDGAFIRLGEDRYTAPVIFTQALLPVLVAGLFIVAVAVAVARTLTQRIIDPINSIDMRSIRSARTYVELNPLLERIQDQRLSLIRQNQELEAADNMRREFTSNVTHEMKTPLHIIAGYAELLRDGMVPAQDTPAFAERIHSEACSMSELVDDVLVLSNLDEGTGPWAEVDLLDARDTINACTDQLASIASERQVALERDLPDEPLYVCCNGRMLRELIANLIKNGIIYNKPNGCVTTRASGREGHVVISVADTGRGISPEDQQRIYERFYRTETSRSKETGGTGLGLAIVKHAVEDMGGTIDLVSEVGVGSTFTVTLPAASFEA